MSYQPNKTAMDVLKIIEVWAEMDLKAGEQRALAPRDVLSLVRRVMGQTCQCCGLAPVAGERYVRNKGMVDLSKLCWECYRKNPEGAGQARRRPDTHKKGAKS